MFLISIGDDFEFCEQKKMRRGIISFICHVEQLDIVKKFRLFDFVTMTTATTTSTSTTTTTEFDTSFRSICPFLTIRASSLCLSVLSF